MVFIIHQDIKILKETPLNNLGVKLRIGFTLVPRDLVLLENTIWVSSSGLEA